MQNETPELITEDAERAYLDLRFDRGTKNAGTAGTCSPSKPS